MPAMRDVSHEMRGHDCCHPSHFQPMESLVGVTYTKQSDEQAAARSSILNNLLHHRTIPEHGLSDMAIEMILMALAAKDSNNFPDNAGGGEREGRIFSSIVQRRNFYMGHGIGRSGDIAAVQPKAAGSTVVNLLSNYFAKDAIRLLGIQSVKSAIVLPLATGMSITMVLLALKASYPAGRRVLWCRIDQKTCLKAIKTAGLEVEVINCVLDPTTGALSTNLDAIEQQLAASSARAEIVAVITTTSCFAPRQPDSVEKVAMLCAQYKVAHLINHAYGLQSTKLNAQVEAACRRGRVDYIVSSTDKNFMVPVGGALVYAPSKGPIDALSQMYPGRASASPLLDFFITLLALGRCGLLAEVKKRQAAFDEFKSDLATMCSEHHLPSQIICSKRNPISLALTLPPRKSASHTDSSSSPDCNSDSVTELGAALFIRLVSGCRVIDVKQSKVVGGMEFPSYGASYSQYPQSYLTIAVGIGQTKEEREVLLKRLSQVLSQWYGTTAGAVKQM